jgi:hypothetical protein
MANTIPDSEVWTINGTDRTGGLASKEDVTAASKSNAAAPRPPRGIFAAFPGATPKYARNLGEEEHDFRETMARMFMRVPKYEDFLKEYDQNPEMKQIAAVLGGQATDGGGTIGGAGYVDFLLQGVQHSFQEKMQVVEVLADDHVAYFFGSSASVFAYSGTLINTKQDDQALNMLRLYAEFGRGSKLASRNTLISLRYDGIFVSGVMTNFTYSLSAETEMAVPFSFNLLVKKLQVLPNPYSGLVTLSPPLAATADGYTPFAVSTTDPGSPLAAPTATPGGQTLSDIAPAATEKTTAELEGAEAEQSLSAIEKMSLKTFVKTFSSPETAASFVNS